MSINNSEKEEKPQQDEPGESQNDIKGPQDEDPKDNICSQQKESKKIFIKNIPFSINDTQLNEFFSKYGNVVKADIMKREDGSSSGVGFVEFANDEDKRNVLLMNREDLVLDGRRLDVKEARPEMDYSKTLYIGNLSYSTTEETLKKFFSDFCRNLKGDFKVNIKTSPNGKSKGHAYIEFENEEDISNAIKANGEKLDERVLKVEMKKPRGIGAPRGRGRGRFQRGMGRRGFGNRRYDYGKDRENYYRDRSRGRSRSYDRSRERSRDRDKRGSYRDKGDREKERERERGERRIREREHGERDSDRGERRDREERRDRGERRDRERDHGERERDRGERYKDRTDRDKDGRHLNMDRNQA